MHRSPRLVGLVLIALFAATPVAIPALTEQAPVVLRLTDYVTMPVTGTATATEGNASSLTRINVLREEPGGTGRLFINDLNGPFYILDKKTKAIATYLDFNGRDAKPGLFDKLPTAAGYANGFISFQFDPAYAQNGVIYTIHLEEVAAPGSSMPDKTTAPGLDLTGYTTTEPIRPPGAAEREAVLIEWKDSNIRNTTFEGTAREVIRVQLNGRTHPMGDMIFNPTARAGDPDWRVMYIACGDGTSGEQKGPTRTNPQRLDTVVGKILRIVPDLAMHTGTSDVSANGRYRIPRDNPFTKVAGARGELWALGLRNPHRLSWDVDPDNRANSQLIATVIGLHDWETVVLVRKGANYGYSEREGNQQLNADNRTGPLPAVDEIPVRISDAASSETTVPRYPVVQYDHSANGGDGIAGGFVYRGKLLTSLRGKYVFGDITTGKLWYADYKEMLAADDGKPATTAAIHAIQIRWNAPADAPDAGERVYPTMSPIVLEAYKARGGLDPDLPGQSTVSGPGRADIRLAVDATGELYIMSKIDGVIRTVVAVTDR